jgi:phosphoribosyl 1,2-cyclic phosphate phosphodiesterase
MLIQNVDTLEAVIYTHEHKDHIAGLDDIRAYNFHSKKKMKLFATLRVQEAIKREFAYAFSETKYPGIPEIEFETIENNKSFELADIQFQPIELLHYKLSVHGFRFNDFTYITDANFINEIEFEKIKGTKYLVLNALRIESHVSHFTLQQAIDIAQKIGAEKTFFTHISHQLGKHNSVQDSLPHNIYLAYDGLQVEW